MTSEPLHHHLQPNLAKDKASASRLIAAQYPNEKHKNHCEPQKSGSNPKDAPKLRANIPEILNRQYNLHKTKKEVQKPL